MVVKILGKLAVIYAENNQKTELLNTLQDLKILHDKKSGGAYQGNRARGVLLKRGATNI